jgi:hypothetical protein
MADVVSSSTFPELIPPVIAKAIVAIHKKLEPLVKSAKNEEYGSSFVPLPDVDTKAKELLKGYGIAVVQPPVADANGNPALKTMLIHKSGVGWSEVTPLVLAKQDPQGHSGSITYMRRVALMGTLGFTAVGEDDDGNEASGVAVKATEEQRDRVTWLLRHLKWSAEQIAREQRNILTSDDAKLAAINYEKIVNERMRDREAEQAALEAEKSGTQIDVTDDTASDQTVKERLQELSRTQGVIPKKLIFGMTNKPFLANCDAEDLAIISKTLDLIESGEREIPDDWYAAGHPPTTATAEQTKKEESTS